MRRLIAIAGAAVVLLVLVLAQLLLPGIAADQLRDRLSKNGKVESVSVSAFPAIELLWHDAGKVVVRMASYRSGTGKLSSLLDEAGGVGTLDATATVLTAGLLTVHNATLSKRGNELTASASVAEADLRSAIPFLQSVTPVASGNGELTVQGTGSIGGFSGSIDATVEAQNGKLVLVPQIPLVGGLLTFTLFNDPHVAVQAVGATPTATGFDVSARAVLR
jgi:hypothetical protein